MGASRKNAHRTGLPSPRGWACLVPRVRCYADAPPARAPTVRLARAQVTFLRGAVQRPRSGALPWGVRDDSLPLATGTPSCNRTPGLLSKLSVAFPSQDFKLSGDGGDWKAPAPKGEKLRSRRGAGLLQWGGGVFPDTPVRKRGARPLLAGGVKPTGRPTEACTRRESGPAAHRPRGERARGWLQPG